MEMNIQKYMSFVKTVEYGSFTKASEILNYSQSGISRMIGDLEKEWNMCLLERDHSGVKPTSDGLRLLPFAKKLCDDFDRLQMEADNLNDLSSGIIRIGTFSSVATYWLPNIIMEFKKDYPNIEYELLIGDYDEIESWITDGRVDCAFICLPASPGIETIFLEEDAFLAILPNKHPLLKYDKIPLKDLSKEPFMLLEKDKNTEISEIFKENNITPNTQFTTWDDYAIMSMVEHGLGVSILPELILQKKPFNIVTRPLNVPAKRQIGLALKSSKNASLATKKFIEYLKYR